MKKIGYAPPLGCVLDVDARYHDAPEDGYFMERSLSGYRCQMKGGVLWTPQGYSFDGVVGSYIHLGSSVGDYTDNFTLMAWIKTSTKGRRIMSKRDGANTQWDWYLHASSGTSSLYDGSAERPGSTDLSDNILRHACVVVNGSDSQHYVNARPDGATISPSISSQSINVNIGAYNDGGNGPWNGLIDEVKIFTRALTQQEFHQEMWRSRRSL